MCFNIQAANRYPITAKEDIPCFKIYEKHKRGGIFKREQLKSIVRAHMVKVGATYKEPLFCNTRDYKVGESGIFLGGSIEEGFHSYHIDHPRQGWDSWARTIEGYGSMSLVIVECIIPKGATYYTNDDAGEYVSDKIKIKRTVDHKLFLAQDDT